MVRYRFELICPHCAKTAEHVSDHDGTHFTPRISCGDCLMNNVEIVELVIVSVVPVENMETKNRNADRVDGYDRDDLGESPDY